MTKAHTAWIVGVISLLAMSRLVPHPPNAVPVAAMALFAGAFFSNRILAYFVPLAAMVLSDLVLGFHSTVWYVYAGVVITVLIGGVLKRISILRVSVAAIVASILFFLITNFGAWLHHGMYPQNLNGLSQAYTAGLPFLRNSVLANLVFSYLVFYGLNALPSMQGMAKHKPS
jgi:small-conductance mechanosensitive channel